MIDLRDKASAERHGEMPMTFRLTVLAGNKQSTHDVEAQSRELAPSALRQKGVAFDSVIGVEEAGVKTISAGETPSQPSQAGIGMAAGPSPAPVNAREKPAAAATVATPSATGRALRPALAPMQRLAIIRANWRERPFKGEGDPEVKATWLREADTCLVFSPDKSLAMTMTEDAAKKWIAGRIAARAPTDYNEPDYFIEPAPPGAALGRADEPRRTAIVAAPRGAAQKAMKPGERRRATLRDIMG